MSGGNGKTASPEAVAAKALHSLAKSAKQNAETNLEALSLLKEVVEAFTELAGNGRLKMTVELAPFEREDVGGIPVTITDKPEEEE